MTSVPIPIDEIRAAADRIKGSAAPSVWPMVSGLVDGSLVMTVDELASTIRVMVERNHIIAEGAGAAPVAVALAGKRAPQGSPASYPEGTSTSTPSQPYWAAEPHRLSTRPTSGPWPASDGG